MTGQSGTPHGLLRVTTSLGLPPPTSSPRYCRSFWRPSDGQLDLLPTDRVIDMVAEGVDVALRIGRLADTSFMARKIGRQAPICAAPAYLARHGTPAPAGGPGAPTLHPPRASAPTSIYWPFRIDADSQRDWVRGRVAVSEAKSDASA